MAGINIADGSFGGRISPTDDITLAEAVENSDVGAVSGILERGGNVNAVSPYGFPILVTAAKNNDLPMVLKLLEYSPKTEAVDCYGRCALVWAIMNKNQDLCSVLLKAHTDINCPGNILVFAIAYEEYALAKYILPKIININSGWIGGKNPLMWAVELRAKDLVSDLLMRGPVISDLNMTDSENFGDPKIEVFMMESLKNDDPETRKIKEQKYAKKINVYKSCNEDPMVKAYKAFFNKLEERIYTPDDIQARIIDLLQSGLKIDVRDSFGRTPFSIFCSNDRGPSYADQDKKIFDLFIAAKADINSTDNKRNTPLHNAVNEQYLNMVRILIKNGADTRKINMYGYTPKDIATLVYPQNREILGLFNSKR